MLRTNLTSFKVIEGDNFEIFLIENHPCSCRNELEKKERFHIENTVCVNKVIPTRKLEEYFAEGGKQKQKEYRLKNDAEIKAKKKLYYEENAERIREKSRKWYMENKEYAAKIHKEYAERNKEAITEYKIQHHIRKNN